MLGMRLVGRKFGLIMRALSPSPGDQSRTYWLNLLNWEIGIILEIMD